MQNGTLYVGVTGNLAKRIFEHKNNSFDGFTKKYAVNKLVYYELAQDIRSAITREKQLKKWKRTWKLNLIERVNPNWEDLDPGSESGMTPQYHSVKKAGRVRDKSQSGRTPLSTRLMRNPPILTVRANFMIKHRNRNH